MTRERGKGLVNHKWPSNRATHLWSPWKRIRGMKQDYRECLHKWCPAIQFRRRPMKKHLDDPPRS